MKSDKPAKPMDTKLIPYGILINGHTISRGDARAEAFNHLVGIGWTEDRADEATDGATVSRAWWGGDDVGTVNEGHDGAVAVTAVTLPFEGGEQK